MKQFLLILLIFTISNTESIAQTDSLLQRWTFNSGNTDTAALRASGLAATVPALSHLTLSNGIQVATIPSYSVNFGMAVSPSTAGDGIWSATVGGPGGILSRVHYVQFSITANSNYTVRVDSITLLSAFYNTSSNTKLALVYSTSNFVTDSSNVTGGTGPSGTLLSSANGAFATPILLSAQSSGTTNSYALALNGATGVTITGGQSIKVRCYFACGSTSSGRYAFLKNVSVKGAVTAFPLSVDIINFKAEKNNNFTIVNWETGTETEIDHYELEQSMDGNDFSYVASVTSQNKTGSNYIIQVETQHSNTYYRLKVVHKSLAITYSRVIQLKGDEIADCILFPNPVMENLNIIFPKEYQHGNITIRNFSGQIIDKATLEKEDIFQRKLSQILPGIYYLTLENNGLSKTMQFIKQ